MQKNWEFGHDSLLALVAFLDSVVPLRAVPVNEDCVNTGRLYLDPGAIDTFAHKDALRELGGRWDSLRKQWYFDSGHVAVEEYIESIRTASPGNGDPGLPNNHGIIHSTALRHCSICKQTGHDARSCSERCQCGAGKAHSSNGCSYLEAFQNPSRGRFSAHRFTISDDGCGKCAHSRCTCERYYACLLCRYVCCENARIVSCVCSLCYTCALHHPDPVCIGSHD